MSNYATEHGDLFIYEDRKQLGFNSGGTNYSLPPNQWYIAANAIPKDTFVSIGTAGYAVDIGYGAAGNVFKTDSNNVSNTVGITKTASLAGGESIEVQSYGLYTFSSVVFSAGDIGLTAYVAPLSSDFQLTTNRNLALSQNGVLIEAGVVVSLTTLFIDFEGDTRGAFNVSQFNIELGEDITTGGNTLLVSMGTDGFAYLADRRKSKAMSIPTVGIYNTTGFTFSAVTYPTSLTAEFTVTAGSPTAGTITIGGVTVTVDAGEISGGVTAIATAIATDPAWSGSHWTANNVGAVVTLTQVYFGQQRNSIAGFVVGTELTTGLSGTIPAGTSVVIQKLGVLEDSSFTFTGNYGKTVWADIDGTVTLDPTVLSYYNDTITPVGIAKSTNEIYTFIGVTSQYNDPIPIGSIIAEPPVGPDYGYLTCDGSTLNAVTNPEYQNLYDVIGNTYGGTNNTDFELPNYVGTPGLQIKYSNWYVQTIPDSPMFRYDTGWEDWGVVPTGSTGNLTGAATAGVTPVQNLYIDIPTNTFGYDPPVTDVFVEIYVQNAAQTIIRKIEPSPVIYTLVDTPSVYSKYGYQIQKSAPNYVRVEFSDNGLAYFDNNDAGGTSDDLFVPIDGTWTYRVFLYKTEQFNRYYDYTADAKISQLWSLGLVDLIIPSTTSTPGYLDRGVTDPTNQTNRLNYNGMFYPTLLKAKRALIDTALDPTTAVNSALTGQTPTEFNDPTYANSTHGIYTNDASGTQRIDKYIDTTGEFGLANRVFMLKGLLDSLTTLKQKKISVISLTTGAFNSNANLDLMYAQSIGKVSIGSAVTGMPESSKTWEGWFEATGDKTSGNLDLYVRMVDASGHNDGVYFTTVINATADASFQLLLSASKANTLFAASASGSPLSFNFLVGDDAGAEATVGNWVRYADAAATTPVDGTGGAPSGSTTLTRNTTTPLHGSGDFQLLVDANNRQGEGVSVAFTIPNEYVGTTMQVSLFAKGGTNGGSYADGNVRLFIYDVTNSVLIPTSQLNINNTMGQFICSWVPNSSSTSYRLILHIATTQATGFKLNFDDVVISPQTFSQGSVISAWQSYTPGTQGFGTVSSTNVIYRRNGENCELLGTLTLGTVTGTEARVNLPTGLTIRSGLATVQIVGSVQKNALSLTQIAIGAQSGMSHVVFIAVSDVITGLIIRNGDEIFPNNAVMSFYASIPVAQWSVNTSYAGTNEPIYISNSNQTVGSDDTGAGTVFGNDGSLIPSFTTVRYRDVNLPRALMPNESPILQVRSIVDGTWINVELAVSSQCAGLNPSWFDAGVEYGIGLIKEATGKIRVYFGSRAAIKAGTTKTWAQVTGAADGYDRWRVVIKNPNAAIEIPPVINAEMSRTSTSGSITAGQPIPFTTSIDAFNIATIATGRFTITVPGTYMLTAMGINSSASDVVISVWKNGVSFDIITVSRTATSNQWSPGTLIIKLITGDYVDLRSNFTDTFLATTRFQIAKIGA